MRMTNLYILHTMKLVKSKWFSTVLMKKSPIHSNITTEQSPNRQTYGVALGFYLEQL